MNQNLELEQQLLGTIIRYPDAIHSLGSLNANAFHEEMHRGIYDAIIRLVGENKCITAPALAMAIGSPQYIASLVSCESLIDLKGTVEILNELAARRMLDGVARQVTMILEKGASSTDALQVINSIKDEAAPSQMHDSSEVAEGILHDLTINIEPYSTGIEKLDECMGGGLFPKKAYGIAARKKVGKTIMLGTISHNLNMAGVKHLFICGEMGEREIHQRVLSRVLDIYPSAFRTGYAERPDIIYKIREHIKSAPKNTIYLDAPGITFDKLKHAIVTAHMKHGIKGFILDYWQLVAGKGGRDSEAFHLGEVAQWIAEIGRKLDLFSITAAQINQDGNTRGGEGMRLAFDQVYHLQPIGKDGGDISMPGRWMEMMDTRYTPWANIGSEDFAGLTLNEKGLYFE